MVSWPPPLTARSYRPSERDQVMPYSGWFRTEILTAARGCDARSRTTPRRIATRVAVIVSAATPVWIALGPEYRKEVDVAMVVAIVVSSGGATSCGSGGTVVTDVVGPFTLELPAASPACT